MKYYTEETIIAALKDYISGVPTAEVCQKYSISSPHTFSAWRRNAGVDKRMAIDWVKIKKALIVVAEVE